MRFGVLGTGTVGRTIAGKLVARGHEVLLGARDARNADAAAWAREAGSKASHGAFADAAAFGEIVFHCAMGAAALEVIRAAGPENLRGKLLVDVSNPLEFVEGAPPRLFTEGGESLAERIQAVASGAKVVKALNTVNAAVMVAPERLRGDHDVFVAGNDAGARARVAELLRTDFGWRSPIDLGDLTAARALEAYLPLWLRLYGVLRTPDFNIRVVR